MTQRAVRDQLSIPLLGVIPKPRVFSSGARDLPLFCCCRFGLVLIAPILRQVLPALIHRFDKLYLLAAPPAFDFLFAGNSCVWLKEALIVYEAGQVVAAHKALYKFVFLLPGEVREIALDARVEDGGLGAVGHDVDEELFGRTHRYSLLSSTSLSVTNEHRVDLREIPRPAGENAGLRDDAIEECSDV